MKHGKKVWSKGAAVAVLCVALGSSPALAAVPYCPLGASTAPVSQEMPQPSGGSRWYGLGINRLLALIGLSHSRDNPAPVSAPSQPPAPVSHMQSAPTQYQMVLPIQYWTVIERHWPFPGLPRLRPAPTTPAVPMVPAIPTAPTTPRVPTSPAVPTVPAAPAAPVIPPPESPSTPPATAAPSAGFMSTAEQQMLNLVNAERTRAGVAPLMPDPQLTQVAHMKAQDMVANNYFSHNSPTLGSPFDMMARMGIRYSTAGENIAGNQTVTAAHQSLMNSPGHRENILNPAFTRIGIGIAAGGPYGMMFAQEFAG